ncbi:MAG: trypsin-like serine protease [Labilithrix sp.]|nr:trypsin-like serine protease [Labilithrix sp.]
MLLRALFCLGLATIAACSAGESVAVDSSDLIGGAKLAEGDLPSALRLNQSCTAARVGPRHILTAAHCVHGGGGLWPNYRAGARMVVSGAAVQDATAVHQSLTVKATHVAAAWLERCTAAARCEYSRDENEHLVSDVALIETVEEIAGIAIAPIDTAPVSAGESVIVAGYGCQSAVGAEVTVTPRLKAEVTRVLPATTLLHWGSGVRADRVSDIGARDLVTPGPAWPTAGPGLCPGDSGGPLYRASSRGATVVGVNASYTFAGSGAPLPVTNWHARLDRDTPHDVGGWLASLGAETCAGETCPRNAAAAPALSVEPEPAATTADLASDGREARCQRAILEVSDVEDAIWELLDTGVVCGSFSARREPLPDGDHRYVARTVCVLDRALTGAEEAAVPRGLSAKGFPGFAFEGRQLTGPRATAGCKSGAL